jgi:hypothetical protein
MTFHASRDRPLPAARSVRAGLLAGLALWCAPLLGCAENGVQMPSVTLAAGTSTVPIYTPPSQQPAPGGLAAPPANLKNTPPAPAQPGGRNGSYTGRVEPLTTGGGNIGCMSSTSVTGWHVYGDRVRFGQFRGTIDANGGVQMTAGGGWIVGQFEGPTFSGQYIAPSGRNSPSCTFLLRLQRTGS